ncbi:hypothetical protein C7974DRAFT_386500 [Boeremia exigua]|uniref:uncharacterized protein n=1 Tax=Boeremia exigua TaxID=749465 RepID=UPI001E8E85E7|nr:uncharacterized protein C7974DRAFT_386500 [Boeremia exigua]KAH6642972.1 hypothetical protein C7974DRAFT_386500 [Boeremia exigua]
MPHLLDCGEFWLTEDDDRQAMAGGFMIGILMTKLPGTQITYKMLCYEKDKKGRDEIRDAFKVALLYASLYISYYRQLIRESYLVDFEDEVVGLATFRRVWSGGPGALSLPVSVLFKTEMNV